MMPKSLHPVEVVGHRLGVVDDLHAAAAEHVATGGRARGSRCSRRPRSASRPFGRRCRSWARAVWPPRGSSRTARAPRPGRWPRARSRESGTPASLSPCARPSAVWPPSCTTTPTSSPLWRLGVDDLEHVLERERLEVEPVAGVVVGRDRLRVAVDHDGLEAGIRERERGVHAAVVELDALPDAVRAGAQDDDLAPVARDDLGLEVVARVVVRRQRRELARAGVDRLVDRANADAPARVAHAAASSSPRSCGDLERR